MTMQLEMRKKYLGLLAVLLVSILAGRARAQNAIEVTKIGTPTFEVVDTHLFGAPTDVFPTLVPNHFPRIAHSNFDQEFSDGLALTGWPQKEQYDVAEFSAPSAVHLGYALVPGPTAPTGSTADFASGPIIPNAIAIRGDVFLNGAAFELNAFNLTPTPAAGFDGASHYVVENWENSDFAPAGLASLVGDYEYRLTLRDAVNDNGYDMVARFSVVPEPVTMSQFGLGILMLAGWTRRRRTR
jgi:hypothetical protein